MKCLKPIEIRNKGKAYTVSCGRCMACRLNRGSEWAVRILHEQKLHQDSLFITLTYNDEHLPKNNSLKRRDLQLFFKRLRKRIKVRYFAAGEYGENYQRPHYHAALFGVSNKNKEDLLQAWSIKVKHKCSRPSSCEDWWCNHEALGFIHTGTLTDKSAKYCAKYLTKKLYGDMAKLYEYQNIESEFLLVSRRPQGIGAGYIAKHITQWLNNGFIIIDGNKRPIPRYYLQYADPDLLETYKFISKLDLNRKEFDKKRERVLDRAEYEYLEIQERKQADTNLKAYKNLKRGKL